MIHNNGFDIKRVDGWSFVYAFLDPRGLNVKYVGKSIDPIERYRKHLTAKGNTYKHKWVSCLSDRGLKPIMLILDRVPVDQIDDAERKWIKVYSHHGLTNMTSGGEGGDTMSGRKLTPEQCKKISNSKLGKPNPSTALTNKIHKSKRVAQIDPKTGITVEIFPSVAEAHRRTGISKTNIAKLANGNIKPTIKKVGGYYWRYV